MNATIHAAITALEHERDRITAAIDALRGLGNAATPARRLRTNERTNEQYPPPKPKRRVVGRPRASAGLDHEAIKDAIVAALKDGPQRPRDVANQIGGDPHAVRFAVKRLQAEGRVRAEGTTNDRRWMLSKSGKPAKEEP